MEVTLKPDNRKATIIEDMSESHVKVRLEDGRVVPWPKSRINQPPKEGEETLKLVIIPAIDRVEELKRDAERLSSVVEWFMNVPNEATYGNLASELLMQAKKEFNEKWGLI